MLRDVQENTVLQVQVQEALKESLMCMLQQADAVCTETDCITTLHEYVLFQASRRLWSSALTTYCLQSNIHPTLCLPVHV